MTGRDLRTRGKRTEKELNRAFARAELTVTHHDTKDAAQEAIHFLETFFRPPRAYIHTDIYRLCALSSRARGFV